MNYSPNVYAFILKCFSCDKGPDRYACAHCRTGDESGVYKCHLVEALLEGFEPPKFKGGGKPERTILPKTQIFKVFEDLKNGKSVAEIAKNLGVSKGVIYRLIKNKEKRRKLKEKLKQREKKKFSKLKTKRRKNILKKSSIKRKRRKRM